MAEFFSSKTKPSIEEFIKLIESKKFESERENMVYEIKNLITVKENLEIELQSYKDTLQRGFQESQGLRKSLEENIEVQKALRQEIGRIKEEMLNISGENGRIVCEKKALEEELRKINESLESYKELVGVCEELFGGELERVLKESMEAINERKTMKKRIHDIVRDCTEKLLAES